MEFDVIIIGAGPGGYVSAIRNAQLGHKTALIEKYPTLGGTCLNVGCIPSKALLDSSEHFHKAVKEFDLHGIKIQGGIEVDLPKMIARKAEVVDSNVKGIDFLMKKNNITVFQGVASFIDANSVRIDKADNSTETLKAKNFIIATGSKPASLPFIQIDKERIITSTQALNLQEVPKNLIVIGGGIIGLEMGSVYSRLGSKVQVIEYMDKIAASMDDDISKEMTRSLKKQGMEFFTSYQVTSVERKGNEVHVTAKSKDGNSQEFVGDYCLVAVGRRPYTDGLNLDKAGILLDEKGRVIVNEQLQTAQPHIYAIGDVVPGPMLAHKAEEEGVYVAEIIAGQKPVIHHHLIPSVAYTWPEGSAVGYTERELKEKNIKYKVGKFPFKASGRAKASNDTDGFIKVLASEDSDEILGVHMFGARCADVIMQAAIAMTYKASAEDIAMICFGHPTFSEAFKEACLDATDKRAIHI
ncbi:MAG: dihydrolipoyl dehydrogenase [Chitinophagales bacterium]|jgi:dihydrolipoamide dehydrogenase|nr:dihydrolipoyl dehydrogenase [Chitinophagales bacterium]